MTICHYHNQHWRLCSWKIRRQRSRWKRAVQCQQRPIQYWPNMIAAVHIANRKQCSVENHCYCGTLLLGLCCIWDRKGITIKIHNIISNNDNNNSKCFINGYGW